VLFIYLAANSLYLLVIALCGRLIPGKKFTVQPEKKNISVLIPCFREDLIILDTASRAATHHYPKDKFTVTVIADKLQPATVAKLRQIPVQVLEVDLNMKSRSLHAALESVYVQQAEVVMILDADNIMGDDCLEKVNAAFQEGVRAVQCHRTAKNKNTSVAWLDAMSEEININLFRRGPAVAGLSAAPIGSGMAFETALIREIFSSEEILQNPGEDREIDMQLMRRKIKMEFIDDALVYDEKVASAGVFEKQRVRWLEAQWNHLKRFSHGDMKTAPKTFLYYNKFFQNLLLPRILTLAVFCLIGVILIIQALFRVPLLYPDWTTWLLMMGLYFLTLFISIPAVFYSMNTLRALSRVPVLMIAMIRALLQMKKKRAEFIHTPKSFTSDENSP
jgi:cellulose synthase/poly-beta-1,6-N-acetylglucosamine synthase-like glycosyltransferase